jgi:hypothetical protein
LNKKEQIYLRNRIFDDRTHTTLPGKITFQFMAVNSLAKSFFKNYCWRDKFCIFNAKAKITMIRTNFFLPATILIIFSILGCSKTDQSMKEKINISSNENQLKVSGDQIINQKGDTVYLRGFGLGGMLHMENFIDGYPANEETMREGLLKVLGKEKYNHNWKQGHNGCRHQISPVDGSGRRSKRVRCHGNRPPKI